MLDTLKGPVPNAFAPECTSPEIWATDFPWKMCLGMMPWRSASGKAALGAFSVNRTVPASTFATWMAFQYWSVATW